MQHKKGSVCTTNGSGVTEVPRYPCSDFEAFKRAYEWAQQQLGLGNWRVYFKFDEYADNLDAVATSTWDPVAMAVVVTLYARGPKDLPLPLVHLPAIHEALELRLASLQTYVHANMIRSQRSDAMFHEVIRALEVPLARMYEQERGGLI